MKQSPVLIGEVLLNNVPVSPVGASTPDRAAGIRIFPSLSSDGWVNIDIPSGAAIETVKIWDNRGKLVWDKPVQRVLLPEEKGVYWVEVRTDFGRKTGKILRV